MLGSIELQGLTPTGFTVLMVVMLVAIIVTGIVGLSRVHGPTDSDILILVVLAIAGLITVMCSSSAGDRREDERTVAIEQELGATLVTGNVRDSGLLVMEYPDGEVKVVMATIADDTMVFTTAATSAGGAK